MPDHLLQALWESKEVILFSDFPNAKHNIGTHLQRKLINGGKNYIGTNRKQLAWNQGSKVRWNGPGPSDWGRTHWRPCKCRKEADPTGAESVQGSGSLWYKLQLGVILLKAQVQRKSFLLIQVWSGHLLDISGRWGSQRRCPHKKI